MIDTMAERFNVAKEVARLLTGEPDEVLRVLPAMAGDIMADGDEVAIADLREALAQHVLHRGPNHEVAYAVLAMLRTHAMREKAQFNKPLH